MARTFDGSRFRVGRVRARAESYTGYHVTYRGDGLTLSGIMNVPTGRGPFPAIVLAHGYIDPEVYTTGRGFERSQAYLAQRGYVVVHVDYRNHATSSPDPRAELELRLGYTEDVINAALALRKARLPYVDLDRIGLLGRSMGGGVALNVAVVAPDLFDAIVAFAPVSSNVVDNYNRWLVRRAERRAIAQRIARTYGSPKANPEFWRNVSPVTFFGRIAVPLQIHHGTADESVPVAWSRTTYAALEAAGADARLYIYPGEQHSFGPAFGTAMARTVRFFDANLR